MSKTCFFFLQQPSWLIVTASPTVIRNTKQNSHLLVLTRRKENVKRKTSVTH